MIAVLVSFSPINQEILPLLFGDNDNGSVVSYQQRDRCGLDARSFDPLLEIRQKRGDEAPPEDPPKTRENRITAVGNDLYSADSRSFLNPFLRISQGVRFFSIAPLMVPPSTVLSSSATDPDLFLSLLPLSPSVVELAYKFRARYTKRKLFCLANHA